jgi:hypothetical protein
MNYSQSIKVNSFNEVDYNDFLKQLSQKLISEIEGRGKEYILGIDEEEYQRYLIESFTIEPLVIDFQSENIAKPTISKHQVENWHGLVGANQVDAYNFIVSYPFTGSSAMFRVRPNPFTLASAEISINDQLKTVSISFTIYKQDPIEFQRVKDGLIMDAFANYARVNQVVESWNQGLRELVKSSFKNQKAKFQSENDFFTAINVKVNPDTISVFTAPTIKKRIIPQPILSKTKEFSSEPMMSREMYDDILKVIYDSGKNMEKKPALYKGKDEEGLRDQFLFVLETRYEGITATGETFNRGGKTDIILKYANDGSNLFVAECKFWHGSSEFLKAISQLFDRYLTWRDSKVALLMFVTNKDFTSVLNLIKTDIKNHPYFNKEIGNRGETSISYVFRLPQDKDKTVFFEVIVFHYDK